MAEDSVQELARELERLDNTWFPDLSSWLPDNVWLYVIVAAVLLLIWLFYPILFTLGVILLLFWVIN